eukprot:TRINITY_DN290_c0_g1_i12.p1 TRINITY_DN290_c0_g1~~TRINITY_DN290_c0_g1_i12.p1  ORF type:complete len:145 (+),score=42.26 TRINITY_DN290_c0_g1_i12:114-548(+)
MVETLIGSKFKDCANKGGDVTSDAFKDAQLVGIYFSAHWCPPCRAFTPVLVEFYNTVNESGKKLEIIFASLDNDAEEFKEYSETMPWKAYAYKDPKIQELAGKFKVGGVPTLVVVNKEGKVVTANARSDVHDKGPDAFDEWLAK